MINVRVCRLKLRCCANAGHSLLIAVLYVASLAVHAGDRLVVYTVNYPLQYFAERIAGEYAEVHFPAPAQVDPALWKPDAETVRAYRGADLVLLNGAGYARWVDEAGLPRSRSVDTSASFADGYVPDESDGGDSANADGRGTGTAVAAHTWLDFSQAALQAETILRALVRSQPRHQAEFERNHAALKRDLMALDLDMQRLVAQHPGKPLFVSRPLYQYFARRYALRLQSLDWAPEVMPSDEDWEQLRFAQEAFPAGWMLWDAQPTAGTVDRLDAMGVGVAVFSPCAGRPAQGDFMDVMKGNLVNLKPIFSGS